MYCTDEVSTSDQFHSIDCKDKTDLDQQTLLLVMTDESSNPIQRVCRHNIQVANLIMSYCRTTTNFIKFLLFVGHERVSMPHSGQLSLSPESSVGGTC